MWPIFEKPKHNLARNPRGLAWLVAFFGLYMPFEFVLEKSIEECAECLEAQERINIWRKLYGDHTEVDVNPDSPAIYEFCIRTHIEHRFAPVLRGFLIRIAPDKTLISGRVRDWGHFLILPVLLVMILVHAVAVLILAALLLIGVLLLAAVNHYATRTHLIGFLKETLSGDTHGAERKTR
jgi:hypothetical protein